MKAKFFALAALVLGMASCQQDFAPEANVGGEVDFTLRVSAPELAATRAGEHGEDDSTNGHNSAYGAIDYLSDADWNEADLRYILEVYDYDATGEYVDENGTPYAPIKDRQVQIVDKYQPVSFDLRLVQGRKYHFVVFADFVENGNKESLPTFAAQQNIGKHHVIGETLADIKVKRAEDEGINNEFTDAYFGSVDFIPSHKTHNTADPIVLTRPYAKVRVVATDLHELNLNVEPKDVEVVYTTSRATAFNALNGNITAEEREVRYTDVYGDISKRSLANHYYNEGYDKDYLFTNAEGYVRHSHMTLFTDYILATNTQETIQFTMTVNDKEGEPIKTTAFNTQIPVQRNHLTTIIGNVLTTATEVNVSINDNFENEVEENPFYVEIWDGVATRQPEYDAETKSYYVWRPSELAWIANEVNVNRNTLHGINVEQMADLDLNCEYWTPIGAGTGKDDAFRGNYNGNGHNIVGLHVENKAGAGLFGYCSGNVKNVTLVEPWIVTNHYAAGIAGWFQAIDSQAHNRISIDNCKVLGGTIIANVDADKDNGDKAGAIAGYVVRGDVTNCFVDKVNVTAYRDLGGVVGYANTGAKVAGNWVRATNVTADQRVEYCDVKPANAGAVVGFLHASAVEENNTIGGGINQENALDVRVIILTNYIDLAETNTDSILPMPAGVYVINGEGVVVRAGALRVDSGKSVVINANGNEIHTGDANNYGFIAGGADTNLVINDANVTTAGGSIGASAGAKVTFNSGRIFLSSKSTSGRYLVYAYGEGTKVVLNDGDFLWDTTKNDKRAYVYCAPGATVEINGGTFGKASTRSGFTAGILGDGNIVIKGGTFGFNPTTWVAEGYQALYDSTAKTWTVSAAI